MVGDGVDTVVDGDGVDIAVGAQAGDDGGDGGALSSATSSIPEPFSSLREYNVLVLSSVGVSTSMSEDSVVGTTLFSELFLVNVSSVLFETVRSTQPLFSFMSWFR